MRGCSLARRLERIGAAFFEPFVHVVVVELLAPQHSRQGLTHDIGRIAVERGGRDGRVELVSLLLARAKQLVIVAAERTMWAVDSQGVLGPDLRQTQVDDLKPAPSDGELIVRRGFGPRPLGIHSVLLTQHDVVVDAILDVRSPVRDAENSLGVGFVLGEKERDIPITIEVVPAQLGMFRGDGRAGRTSPKLAERRPFGSRRPGP